MLCAAVLCRAAGTVGRTMPGARESFPRTISMHAWMPHNNKAMSYRYARLNCLSIQKGSDNRINKMRIQVIKQIQQSILIFNLLDTVHQLVI